MKKDTIELARFDKCTKGYGWINGPSSISNEAALNKLCEWSKDKNVTIYSHSVRREEENEDKYPEKYHFPGHSSGDWVTSVPAKDIPYVDWVYYIDIWYQEK